MRKLTNSLHSAYLHLTAYPQLNALRGCTCDALRTCVDPTAHSSARSCYNGLSQSGPDGRATGSTGVRKVRAPKGRMLANGQAGQPDGKRRRKEDSHWPALGRAKGKAETVV